ncbi:MAG TPA: AI-2E family transporter [Acidobacteriaceae bacterium]|nr:AI-2E family transporter [Acidobacteriaceae bacterium]
MTTESSAAAGNQITWKIATLFLLTLAVIIECLRMLGPFMPAIVGALVLAIITRRPHLWLRSKTGNRTVAASLALLTVTLSIIVPGFLLLENIGQHLLNAVRLLQNGTAERSVSQFLAGHQQIASVLQSTSQYVTFGQATERAARFISAHLVGVLSNSVAALTQIIIMLFLLFFLYRDDEAAMRFLYRMLPLHDSEARNMMARIADTIRATVLGRFIIAAVQGIVAGATFAALGIDGATILGILTALVAIVPSFGAYIVWLPVAAYLALTGNWGKMAILLAVGALIISTLDNLLYPALVGVRLHQHTASVFLSLIGGVWLFGVPGLVLGPVLFCVTESLLDIWKQRLKGPEPVAIT